MTTEKDVQPLRTIEEINEMKDTLKHFCSYRDYVLFTFGINIGLRVSDILALKVSDVRGRKHIVKKEKKTKESKYFFIPQGLRELLDKYTAKMDDDAPLFPSRKGTQPISTTQAYRILNKAADLSGIESVGTHTMRKTFGYHYYKKTQDIMALMQIFGHSSPSITKRYIGITREELDNSLEGFML